MGTPEPRTADGAVTTSLEEGHPEGGTCTVGAPVTGSEPDRGLAEASPVEVPAGPGPGRPAAGATLTPWSALLDRVQGALAPSGVRDGLLWLVLIAVLGLYGWYAASPGADAVQTPLEPGAGADAAIQRVLEEKAALARQIAEASARIAALEATLEAQRQQADSATQPQPDVPTVPRGPSALAAELGGRETERGILLDLSDADLSFPIGKATLPERDLPVLDRIAAALRQHPVLMARVEGHTDSAGRDEVNLLLSQARAEAVKGALVARGVSGERIAAVGYGETRPIADNGTRAGRDRNRRIEVYLSDGPP